MRYSISPKILKAVIQGTLFLLSAVFLISCSSSAPTQTQQKKGVWHIIKPGESLESISKTYSVSTTTLQRLNDIFDAEDIAPGMRLFIPTPKHIKIVAKKEVQQPRQGKVKFAWPAQGTISSGFGMRHGRMHEGLDITKDRGKDIRASANGVVEYAGYRKGYGKTIIINHGSGFKTLYAHNSKIYVTRGKRVKGGAIIAQMGSSGKSTGIHLHFEIRLNGKPQNPLRYLPVR